MHSALDSLEVLARALGDGATDSDSTSRSWAGLPHDLLAAILHPSNAVKEARLVCRSWRDAHDAGVKSATLRLSPLGDVGPDLPRAPPRAQLLRLDAAHMALGCPYISSTPSLDLNRLAGMLQRWPLAAPLQLDLSNMEIGKKGAQPLEDTLRCPAFAAGGLQVLDLTNNNGIMRFAESAGQLISALFTSPQTSALRELRLAGCGLREQTATTLFAALQAATHLRSLMLLDLSHNYGLFGSQGLVALPTCLRASPHLSSLQRLLLRQCGAGPRATAPLAGAVAEAHLPLVALDLSDNCIRDGDAAAWAAVLCNSTCLSGLEVLDLGRNEMTHAGVSQLADALQAATHVTGLRRLSLLPKHAPSTCVERVARLLQAAPHLAASLQDLDFRSNMAVAADAMEVVCEVVLAGGTHLPRLTRLDLGRCSLGYRAGLHHLCTALVAGTQLTGLRELCLASNSFLEDDCKQLAAALVASTQLSGLRALKLDATDQQLASVGPMTDLLQAAPHLRGLTRLLVGNRGQSQQSGTLAALRPALQLLPGLRRLTLVGFSMDAAGALGMAAALEHAPCAPSLEELDVATEYQPIGCGAEAKEALHLAAALQACTSLTGLRRLTLTFFSASLEGLEEACRVLGACRHLAGLQELRLQYNTKLRTAPKSRQKLYEALACGGQLAGVRMIVS